ncbi:molybdopterin-dependent oxidoreductase [Pseudolysinimonas yzui]|uniref:molybdopterin-dependent oxidoreductase n=1 Tax=Pseudolysinimonas yzui TaxID=2708254 RepID=UPI00174DF95E|nr:molybdopterin-dependent oxidoreductase [Pseudolysinimonas yzui]
MGEFAAAANGTRTSPLRAIGRWLIDAVPTPLIELLLALLRRASKPVVAVTLLVIWLGSAALAALGGRGPLIVTLALFGSIGLVALWRRDELNRVAACFIGLAALGAGVGGAWLSPTVALATTLALALGVVVLRSAASARLRGMQRVLPVPQSPLPAAGAVISVPGISPLFTSSDRFFVTDVAFPAPVVAPDRWRLRVVGLVDRPLVLTHNQLHALPSVEIDAVLMCVHNPVGGPSVGNARWQGVRLIDVLAIAGVSRDADHLRLTSVDGFSAGLNLKLIEEGYEPVLAYAMNGVPLTRAHGAPLRLLVPGIHGYDANIKWLQSIEATGSAYAIDYAERKGWPREPSRMGPQCRIDVPATSANLSIAEHVAAGVAWAPPHGVVRVELRIDGGNWEECTLGTALGPHAWRQWFIRWQATSGRHYLEARAWGRDGVQSETIAAPYPGGASGYHSVEIDVNERRPVQERQSAWWLTDHVRGRVRTAKLGLSAWLHRELPHVGHRPK